MKARHACGRRTAGACGGTPVNTNTTEHDHPAGTFENANEGKFASEVQRTRNMNSQRHKSPLLSLVHSRPSLRTHGQLIGLKLKGSNGLLPLVYNLCSNSPGSCCCRALSHRFGETHTVDPQYRYETIY